MSHSKLVTSVRSEYGVVEFSFSCIEYKASRRQVRAASERSGSGARALLVSKGVILALFLTRSS